MTELYKLSYQMLDTLMECHERELMTLAPLASGMARQCKGLINRGMVIVKPYTTKKGKTIYALFITGLGKNFLKNI